MFSIARRQITVSTRLQSKLIRNELNALELGYRAAVQAQGYTLGLAVVRVLFFFALFFCSCFT